MMLQINHLNKQPTMAQTLARDSRLPSSGNEMLNTQPNMNTIHRDQLLDQLSRRYATKQFSHRKFLGLNEQGLSAVVVAAAGYRAAGDNYAALKKVRFSKAEVLVEV